MQVLVTGGTGVVGTGTVTALVRHGHRVRLLARHAREGARQWPDGVEPRPGDVADPSRVNGCAEGCEVVLHLAAIVEEEPPHRTFERVNVEGTRNILEEAKRAGVKRFVYVSSLGADRGDSPYHQSKRAAEALVRDSGLDWVIVRPGSVYGPGDEQLSLLLRMVRTLPAVPVLSGGDVQFQPLWHEDLAEALARVVERDDLGGRELDLAGPDLTSQNDLLDRLGKLTSREPTRIPLPDFLASAGLKLLDAVGVEVPFNEGQFQMLREGNLIADPRLNALTATLHVAATPLDAGLERLADAQEEQLPAEGVGSLTRKRFWGDIQGSGCTPDTAFDWFTHHFQEATPGFMEVAAEPGTPQELAEGATLTLSLPLRGHVQVRVAEANARRATLLTLSGHPLAGAVRFLAEHRGECVRFEVQVYDRPASVVDFIAMRTVGDFLQNRSWERVVRSVAEGVGGTLVDGVHRDSAALDEEEAESIQHWLEELVNRRKREENAPSSSS
ncbi:MAG TPA: NAD-dependent epimerase/dehydratase family protein [Gemmatimonadaceae bacterium]